MADKYLDELSTEAWRTHRRKAAELWRRVVQSEGVPRQLVIDASIQDWLAADLERAGYADLEK